MNNLKKLVHDPATVVVDVRNAWEYKAEHIPGAVNIPLDEIPGMAEELKSFKRPLVLYCRSGNRSGMAVSILQQLGLTELYNGGSLDDMKFLLN